MQELMEKADEIKRAWARIGTCNVCNVVNRYLPELIQLVPGVPYIILVLDTRFFDLNQFYYFNRFVLFK